MKGENTDVHVGYHYRRLAEPVLTGIYECNSRYLLYFPLICHIYFKNY